MTETERAVDDAERAREQDGGRRRFRVPPRLAGLLPRRVVRDELGVLLVLGLLIAGIGIPYPDFLAGDNLLSTAHNSVYISLMACGMVFALAMREVDLSVGGSYAMCLVVGALLVREGTPPWLAVPVMLATGILLGVFNALVTTLLALPSFIVTLGTLLLFRGVGLALADGKQITDLPLDDSFFTLAGGDAGGVPFALWVLLAVVVVLSVVLARTRFEPGCGRSGRIPTPPSSAEYPSYGPEFRPSPCPASPRPAPPPSPSPSTAPATRRSARATSCRPSPRASSAAPRWPADAVR